MDNNSSTLRYLELLYSHLQQALNQRALTAEECDIDEISFFFQHIMLRIPVIVNTYSGRT